MSIVMVDTIAHAIALSNSGRFASERYSSTCSARIGSARYADEMEIKDTRLNRLKLLLDQHDGNKAALARAIKKQPAQVSQWFNHVRTINEDSAREIEERMRLPVGWMDLPLDQTPKLAAMAPPAPYTAWPFKSVRLADIVKLSPEMLERLERVINFHLGEMLIELPGSAPRAGNA